jgi:alginate O-acetyltransferase complex protein AlgI
VLGLFKKVVIGDNLASIANAVFNADRSTVSGAECLVGVYAFALQIYADFSGYSSIAQGVAKWMGYDLMTNFRMPYLAISPSDFWRRWHISLSTWLRDYVYISFGGNRHGRYRTYRNLFLTMLLGGLWHGANWTFIAWGAFHGLLLCVYRFMWDSDGNRTIRDYGRLPGLVRAVVFFQLVCIGWLLFRAQSIGQAWSMLHAIATDFRITGTAVSMTALIVFYTLPLMIYEYWVEFRDEMTAILNCDPSIRAAIYAYCAFMLIIFPAPVGHEFIYFQF